jgi:hypothetical protein
MKLVGIPVENGTDIHKSGCRDIGTKYKGLTYDDVSHFEVDYKSEIPKHESGKVNIFPCVKIPKGSWFS